MEDLIKIIEDKFKIKVSNETSITSLAEDSFGKVELLMEVEEKLNIKIPEEDILSVDTVGELANLIKKIKTQHGFCK
jgi:acyl carrier protein